MLAHPVRDGALRSFCARAKLASNSSTALAGDREAAGEMVIGVHGVRSLPARIGLFLGLILTLSVGCGGGGGGETTATPPATPAASTPAATGTETTVGIGQAETLKDIPFSLNTDHPVPPDFREAFERRALISVQFYKMETDPLGYPEGLDVDQKVSATMDRLRTRYPTIEFFSYDIDNPGTADKSEGLERGQYGTLAAQLGVGFTPFIAMLAPSGEQYVITNLYQGYVSPPVLSQALYDLSSVKVEDNTSDVDVVLEQLDLTESGGGLEYVTIHNRSTRPVNLQGFSLRVLDPESAEVDPDAPGVTITDPIEVQPGQSVSIGRVPSVVDANGEKVAGTFEGGESLELSPGDQVALLDSGGAVASTITV
jgi:hypothetical protein